jgi:hypothetical protein
VKIPKELSESVYRRRTDNTMAKRKSTKAFGIFKLFSVVSMDSDYSFGIFKLLSVVSMDSDYPFGILKISKG